MKVFLTLTVALYASNLWASYSLSCPEGTHEVNGIKQYDGKDVDVRACTNKEGNLHGPTIVTFNNKVIDKCNYDNGLTDGMCRSWYFTGSPKREARYSKGKLHGEMKAWYQNGAIKLQAYYENGEPVGIWKKWTENGELVSENKH